MGTPAKGLKRSARTSAGEESPRQGSRVAVTLVSVVLAAALLAMAAPALAAPDPTLKAYYPFNGNAVDESGSGNDGAIFGATPAPDRLGAANRAMSFDGVDDYIEVPDNGASLDLTDDFTIALWMRPLTASGFVLNKHINGVNAEGSWYLADFPPFNLLFQATPFPGGPLPGAGTSAAIPTGAWTFVALTYDDPTDAWTLYVDGSLDTSGSLPAFEIQDTSLRMLIGVDDPPMPGSFFTGDLDEIRIYKRVLSEGEVAALYGSFDFDGFLPPVDNLPTLNEVKAGRSVPVKFSLGGDQGLDIFAAGYPKSHEIDCSSATNVDGIESTVTAGSSGLSYDPATDQYTYIWKTKKTWASTCRQLVVEFQDGTIQRANFEFR